MAFRKVPCDPSSPHEVTVAMSPLGASAAAVAASAGPLIQDAAIALKSSFRAPHKADLHIYHPLVFRLTMMNAAAAKFLARLMAFLWE
jgi:hypothetical protein